MSRRSERWQKSSPRCKPGRQCSRLGHTSQHRHAQLSVCNGNVKTCEQTRGLDKFCQPEAMQSRDVTELRAALKQGFAWGLEEADLQRVLASAFMGEVQDGQSLKITSSSWPTADRRPSAFFIFF